VSITNEKFKQRGENIYINYAYTQRAKKESRKDRAPIELKIILFNCWN